MVGDSQRYTYGGNPEHPIDHDLISTLREMIDEHRKGANPERKDLHETDVKPDSKEPDLSLD